MSEFDNRSPEDVEYGLDLPYHLAAASREEAAMGDELCELLTEFEFIEYKVLALAPQSLIDDYDLALQPDISIAEAQKESLKLIQSSIRLSANILLEDKTQLSGQLLGRLLFCEIPEIQTLLEQALKTNRPWLRPLKSSMMPPCSSLQRTLSGHTMSVQAVAITPDEKQIVSASDDKTLKVWDLESGSMLKTLSGHTKGVRSVAITPDGKQIVSASWDNSLKVWDLESGRELKTLWGHSNYIEAVAITPDGKQIVSASWDNSLKIWDLESGHELKTLLGHTDHVQAVTITPNGRQVISASADESLKVWDLESGCELKTLRGHDSHVRAVAITPDAKQAVSASADESLRIWDLDSGIYPKNLESRVGYCQNVLRL